MEQEMLYLNYDGRHTGEVYGISTELAERISELLAEAAIEITVNFEEYAWKDGEDIGLHKGKVLKRFMRDISNFQERIVVISLADRLINKMINEIAINQALKELKK